MMLFSLFGILLFVKFVVFWRELVLINLLLLTGLMYVDFLWLHQLSRWVLQGCWTTHSQLELFLNVRNPLKLPLCSKKVMQGNHLIIVQFMSLQSYLLKIIERHVDDSLYDFIQVNNLIYYLVRPGLFPIRNGRLLDLFRQSGFRKPHGSETALFKNESWWALTKFGQQQSEWSTTC